MTDQTADLTQRMETIRRSLDAVANDRPTPEQIAEWNAADKEMAQRVRAALPGVPLHHAYAVLQAVRVVQRLDAAAAVSAGVAPATSQAALRGRIAEAALRAVETAMDDTLLPAAREEALAGIAAVLPATTDRAAVERVRAVLETEAVVGRSALEYRGLIASALTAAEAGPADTGQDDGETDCCGAEPPANGTWGDRWCTCPPGHTGEHQCQPCTDRHGAPGWTVEQPAAAQTPKET